MCRNIVCAVIPAAYTLLQKLKLRRCVCVCQSLSAWCSSYALLATLRNRQFLSFSMPRRLKVGKNPSYTFMYRGTTMSSKKIVWQRVQLLTMILKSHVLLFQRQNAISKLQIEFFIKLFALIAGGGSYNAHKRNYTLSLCLEFDGSSQFFIFQEKWLWNGGTTTQAAGTKNCKNSNFYFPRL